MPERSTLEYVADLIIRRTIESCTEGELAAALERVYPFGDDPTGYTVWVDTLKLHGITTFPPPPSKRLKPDK